MSRGRLLVVEDKEALRKMMTLALKSEGYSVRAVGDVSAAVSHAEDADSFDLVLTDLRLPDGTGIDVLKAFKADGRTVPVVVMTAFGSIGTAVEAMKLGAVDFLEKPVELDELFPLVEQWVECLAPAAGFQPPGDAPAIIGSHPSLKAALKLLRKVAPLDSTILLAGESGTGKEVFARAAHALSKRNKGPFVAVNCAAIPESLMENELFGHEKGAFTGASARRAGRFEQARGGTIFLDEIGELKLEVQGKVLRVLEEKVFERVGGGKPMATDARVITATNRDLKTMVAHGEFRQDLYYRLEVFPVHLPALRERTSDIPDLVHHLGQKIADRLGLPAPQVSPQVMALLVEAPWPGNVRQLANFVERAMILNEGPWKRSEIETLLAPDAPGWDERIRQALTQTQGDKKQAAALLEISYRALQRRIKELDLEGFPRYRG